MTTAPTDIEDRLAALHDTDIRQAMVLEGMQNDLTAAEHAVNRHQADLTNIRLALADLQTQVSALSMRPEPLPADSFWSRFSSRKFLLAAAAFLAAIASGLAAAFEGVSPELAIIFGVIATVIGGTFVWQEGGADKAVRVEQAKQQVRADGARAIPAAESGYRDAMLRSAVVDASAVQSAIEARLRAQEQGNQAPPKKSVAPGVAQPERFDVY